MALHYPSLSHRLRTDICRHSGWSRVQPFHKTLFKTHPDVCLFLSQGNFSFWIFLWLRSVLTEGCLLAFLGLDLPRQPAALSADCHSGSRQVTWGDFKWLCSLWWISEQTIPRRAEVSMWPSFRNKILFLYSFSRQEFGEGDHSWRVRKPGQHQGFLYISLAQGSHAVVGMLLSFSVISPEFTAHYDLSDDDALDEVRNGSSPQLDWI